MENNNYELYHHGILGQKWGIRRYQNEDGTLTEAGRKRLDKRIDKYKAKTQEKNGVTKGLLGAAALGGAGYGSFRAGSSEHDAATANRNVSGTYSTRADSAAREGLKAADEFGTDSNSFKSAKAESRHYSELSTAYRLAANEHSAKAGVADSIGKMATYGSIAVAAATVGSAAAKAISKKYLKDNIIKDIEAISDPNLQNKYKKQVQNLGIKV